MGKTYHFYDEVLNLSKLGYDSLDEAIDYIQNYCRGIVWSEIETTEQPLPKYAKYIDTFYNINVYYDFVTESFLFEEFN